MDCLCSTVLQHAKQTPAKDAYTQAHNTDKTNTTVMLTFTSACVKAKHRGSATDTTLVVFIPLCMRRKNGLAPLTSWVSIHLFICYIQVEN